MMPAGLSPIEVWAWPHSVVRRVGDGWVSWGKGPIPFNRLGVLFVKQFSDTSPLLEALKKHPSDGGGRTAEWPIHVRGAA